LHNIPHSHFLFIGPFLGLLLLLFLGDGFSAGSLFVTRVPFLTSLRVLFKVRLLVRLFFVTRLLFFLALLFVIRVFAAFRILVSVCTLVDSSCLNDEAFGSVGAWHYSEGVLSVLVLTDDVDLHIERILAALRAIASEGAIGELLIVVEADLLVAATEALSE